MDNEDDGRYSQQVSRGGMHSPSGVDPRGAAPPDDEVLGQDLGEPGGAAKQYDQSVLPVARFTYTDQAPRRFHIGVFPVHTSGGAGKHY